MTTQPRARLSTRQLGILEREGLVEIAKFRERRHAATRVRLSPTGRDRFNDYLDGLRKVVQSNVE
ncbi:transcriptional regulator [Streptomyces ureilyticus]|uniref:Winged helix DNA-binding domain-containing protein n=1 Tax=Streptomyces ureilyticus TaxID=1775131 RepID=A0ABX0E301_9ACTN|nr:transcriptional regulator [Streptomyces ureilyticus]NGO47624.1 hypothetical protein [Streptomyces ureilyticus]